MCFPNNLISSVATQHLAKFNVLIQADAVLHFGTHGSLEFMPGKQVGMSGMCFPDSLISTIPNIYYYAANNPSEATIAKRRSYANTISYLTPPAENAGLYKGLKVGSCCCLGTLMRSRLMPWPYPPSCLFPTPSNPLPSPPAPSFSLRAPFHQELCLICSVIW